MRVEDTNPCTLFAPYPDGNVCIDTCPKVLTGDNEMAPRGARLCTGQNMGPSIRDAMSRVDGAGQSIDCDSNQSLTASTRGD